MKCEFTYWDLIPNIFEFLKRCKPRKILDVNPCTGFTGILLREMCNPERLDAVTETPAPDPSYFFVYNHVFTVFPNVAYDVVTFFGTFHPSRRYSGVKAVFLVAEHLDNLTWTPQQLLSFGRVQVEYTDFSVLAVIVP